MLHQFSKDRDLSTRSPDRIEVIADDFEALPLFFLNFHGGTLLGAVLEALDVAVY